MSGLGIGDLGWPNDEYRPDLHVPGFETEADAADEDRTRGRILRADSGNHGGGWGEKARALADKLDPDLNPEIPETPASARYMRDQRIRIIGALWKLLVEVGLSDVRRCDIIREDWNLDLAQFIDERPARLKEEIRATINRIKSALRRQEIDTSGRFFFAVLHGEFDPTGLMYQLHFHVLEEHAKAIVADNLRDRAGFVSPRRKDADEHGASGSHVTTPVRIARRPITNLAYALGYLIKSYWLQYPRGRSSAGSKKATDKGQRIMSPYLSAQLLWMADLTISDLVMMIGLRVTKDGLTLTRGVHE